MCPQKRIKPKEMVILSVDQGDIQRLASYLRLRENTRRIEAAEATANHHHPCRVCA
jgi:hypothetical protein